MSILLPPGKVAPNWRRPEQGRRREEEDDREELFFRVDEPKILQWGKLLKFSDRGSAKNGGKKKDAAGERIFLDRNAEIFDLLILDD